MFETDIITIRNKTKNFKLIAKYKQRYNNLNNPKGCFIQKGWKQLIYCKVWEGRGNNRRKEIGGG